MIISFNADGTPIFVLAPDGGDKKLSKENTAKVEAAWKDLINAMIEN